jgi:hypothetical protein
MSLNHVCVRRRGLPSVGDGYSTFEFWNASWPFSLLKMSAPIIDSSGLLAVVSLFSRTGLRYFVHFCSGSAAENERRDGR